MVLDTRYRILETSIEHQESSIKNRGFTLIEVIIFIVVAGVISSAIFIPLFTCLKESMTPERVATATYLAQQKMEEITKDSYNSVQTGSQVYTDIAGFPNYQWSWNVTLANQALSSSLTDVGYKLILVRVKENTDNEVVELQTVVTERPADE